MENQTQMNSNSFPEEWKAEFEGLLYLGQLEQEVTSIPFHNFIIRTLNTADKLGISLLTKEYQETVAYGRAYRAAVVAASLISVDGRPLVPSSKSTNTLRQKYEYITNGWYDSVIDTLYLEVDALEGRVLEVLKQIGMVEETKPTPIFEDEQESTDTPKDGK
jgi:hypothetical protein